ncbi:EF-hand [Gonapodya prolifera JEL478]|uniref:EF-hand n=1 Tax=Gonapodya prolifera (strain JEL478) TaxID=1344416 RepID=A0A139AYL2_GONPJ|nr:EF-hand [Gonapodya prolifera JEL478]|eukprot:KXS21545.1 EF-hand [Gonapodya prolifera JEL478]
MGGTSSKAKGARGSAGLPGDNASEGDDDRYSKMGRFNDSEFRKIKEDFLKKSAKNADPNVITKEQFKETIASHLTAFPTYAQRVFLERLFDAFDEDGSQSIDLMEFMEGLAVFLKGTNEEKLELSFKLYDINKDGDITRAELTSTLMNMLSSMYPDEDPTVKVNEMVGRLFDDLDIDGNGQLSLDEFKLSGLKEPLIVDFLDQFLEPREEKVETIGEMGPLVIPEMSLEQRTRSSRSVISLDGSTLPKSNSAANIPSGNTPRLSRPVSTHIRTASGGGDGKKGKEIVEPKPTAAKNSNDGPDDR